MRPDDLPRALGRGLATLYTIHGDEALLALESVQLIRDTARERGYSERDVLTVEAGFSWSQLEMVGNSFSLFADKKLIELRIPSGKPGVEGGKAIEAYATRLPDDAITLVILPKLDRTTLSGKWFNALAANGEVIEARTVERAQLPAWIAERLKLQNQRLSADAMQWLADRLEGNLLAAFQEIQKLALLHPSGEITLEQLQASVANVARYDVFQLGNALLAGDASRFMRMLDGLAAEGEAPHLVLWALAEETRNLYKIAKGLKDGQPLAVLLKEHKIWGDKQKLIGPAAERLALPVIREALNRAAHIDRLNKGIGSGEVWDELREMALPLLGKA
jgi:DNA polymerase III subunit delta